MFHKIKWWLFFLSMLAITLLLLVGIILLLFDLTSYAIPLVALSATVFMLFTYKETSREISYYNLYMSYGLAAALGYLGTIIGGGNKVVISFAVVMTLAAMLLLKATHAPAVGFALSFLFTHLSLVRAAGVLSSIMVIIFISKTIRYVLRHQEEFYPRRKISFQPRRKKDIPTRLHFIEKIKKLRKGDS